jgi:hypothetical protein
MTLDAMPLEKMTLNMMPKDKMSKNVASIVKMAVDKMIRFLHTKCLKIRYFFRENGFR